MTATIIDGKARAAKLRQEVAAGVAVLRTARGITPGIAVILVGDDPASQVYVRNKNNACKEAGINSFEIVKPATITQAELLSEIKRLNVDARVHGILVQLPLPAQIDPEAVINAIDPAKDVDGFHVVNAGKLAIGKPGFVPCTPAGCLLLLKEQLGNLSGKHAVIVGRSNIVGKPMAQLLLMESCTVTICHSKTEFLVQETRRGDILVAAIGKPNFIKGHMIKPGATVIDVGINRVDGKLVGDVEFESAKEIAAAITPVPGGVGPMTIACLLQNTLAAAS
ncbi:MAG: bifunctional methylenetetrahydrofolate dehydrogenase/methenyltetrahydrofolate cyclohydrolase FolD [Rickettsiales bacterium]|jgi:methylenetetrahydrofolate dehydrogenase (NADP+)/methenyltetrahydrofolate cyclohydrolase|nr:bifunctional methylenetetrahydrofolate dehydrogenase/methenyltetrahydrofolate cyclohydrolase FolD [Rickettsiales bacterium]